jgi:glycosyltransferase involved in cell wall biosynthesis
MADHFAESAADGAAANSEAIARTADGRLRAVVFGDRAGSVYRAGRTERGLARVGVEAEDATDLAPEQLAERLGAMDGPVWFVRAGAWPATPRAIVAPPSSATGLPLCAVSGVIDERPGETSDDECRAWSEWQKQTGGAPSDGAAGVPLPTPAGVYVERPIIDSLRGRLLGGASIVAALEAELREPGRRIVRPGALDLHFDPHLRVAQVVTSLQRGGAERVTLDLHQTLPEHGVRSCVVVLGCPTREAFAMPPATIDVSRTVDRLAAAARALADFAADAVHAHLLGADAVRVLAATKIPVLITVHNMRPGWPAGLTELERGDVGLLAACSQAVERDLAAAGTTVPTRTVWNGIDFGPLRPGPATAAAGRRFREEHGIEPDDFVLLSLANPRPQKRLERLPAIVATTQAEFDRRGTPRTVRLLVAGEASRLSPQAQEAERQFGEAAAACGNADRIVRLGAVSDLPTVLAAADVLVSCSAYEGLSLAHLEALAAGVAVAATDVGGTREIAEGNEAVRLVPPEASAELFAAALADMATTRPASGRESAATHFHRSRMAAGYRALYPRAVAAARSGRPKRGIWLVANNFSTGGAQSSARRLLTGLAAEGIRVRAAVLQEHPEHPTPGRTALMTAGIPVFALPPAGSIDVADAVPLLLEQIDADPPEAVVFWNALPTYKLLLAHGLLDTRVFDVSPGEMYYTAWDKYFAAPRSGWPYRTPRDFGRRLAGMIVKYHGEAELAARYLGAPVTVIPNGVVVGPMNGFARRWANERLVIGTAARLSPQKKLEELFAALRAAGNRLPSYVLRIAGGPENGSAEYAEKLRQSAGDLPIEWLGDVQNLHAFHHELDLFAMISEPAGCPNASLEAMAAGLPVVATDFGGAAEQVVDGECGRIVRRGDASALAEALCELAADRELRVRYGKAARRRAEAEFDVSRMVRDYRAVLLG